MSLFRAVRTRVRSMSAHALSAAVMCTAVAAALLALIGSPAAAADLPAEPVATTGSQVTAAASEDSDVPASVVAPAPSTPTAAASEAPKVPPPGTESPPSGPDQGGAEELVTEVPVPAPGTNPGTGVGAPPPKPVPAPGTDPEAPNTGGAGGVGDDDGDETEGESVTPLPTLPLPLPLPVPVTELPVAQVPDFADRVRAQSDDDLIRGDSSSDSASGARGGSGAGGADSGSVGGASGSGRADAGDGADATPGESGAGTGGTGAGGNADGSGSGEEDEGSPVTRTVTRTVKDIVEVVPESAKVALALLAALAVVLGAGYLFSTARARRLARQRRELLQEVGLLQGALLPAVPATFGSLRTSVAYRPAEGPGAGGDFYDVLPLTGGRVGFILGDVSGHGRGALARTAFMRYTLRAYLEAGLEPRMALQVAGRVIDDNLGGDFATVLIAIHDPSSGSLTYASAGHPAPVVVGRERHVPVTSASSPPIGIGVRTGLRQTTVPLEPGSVACLFTDGLLEARTADGVLGRERLEELLDELGRDANAEALLAAIAAESRLLADDMATCLITPTTGVTAGGFRTEQLELSAADLEGPLAARFLEACEIPAGDAERALREARGAARHFGGVVMHVVFGTRMHVEVLPRNVESIEAASRRSAAAR